MSRPALDVLHLAGWGHPVLLGSMLYAAARGIPVVTDTDTPEPVCESAWKRQTKAVIYPSIFRIPELFLPAGARQAAYLRKYSVESDRIRPGRMTADVEAIAAYAAAFNPGRRASVRERLGIREPSRTAFLFMGRLEDFKGVEDLLDAYLRLRAQRSDVDLLFAGSGRLEGLVRAAASTLRSVHYLGHLTGDRVWEAYCAADVLVLPSRFEPWGLVVNEAMAAGLPVIATDVVGCRGDLIEHEVTGLVIPAGNIEMLCSAMSELADKPALRRAMGGRAQQTMSGWTLAKQAEIIVSAWDSVSR